MDEENVLVMVGAYVGGDGLALMDVMLQMELITIELS